MPFFPMRRVAARAGQHFVRSGIDDDLAVRHFAERMEMGLMAALAELDRVLQEHIALFGGMRSMAGQALRVLLLLHIYEQIERTRVPGLRPSGVPARVTHLTLIDADVLRVLGRRGNHNAGCCQE